jgi:hypothetical protein
VGRRQHLKAVDERRAIRNDQRRVAVADALEIEPDAVVGRKVAVLVIVTKPLYRRLDPKNQGLFMLPFFRDARESCKGYPRRSTAAGVPCQHCITV